ncbi:MAG: helix-turn-helix transcriptional regulator [Tidjanibacter sp.]|nr:helix-turn-helix transcriptional regulator [Tidjanibacter sp.]
MENTIDIQRVIKVVEWLIFEGIAKNRRDLAEKLGYTESSFSQIINGKVNISERFIKKLYNLDDRLSEEWIKTGKGEMLIIEATHTINGDGNTAIHGNGNQVNSETTRFLALLEKKDEQIDRLLAIIESVTNK